MRRSGGKEEAVEPKGTAEGSMTGEKSRGKFFRIGLAALVCLLLGAAVLVALAPTLISTAPGKDFAERLINGRIAGSVSMDRLSLSWRGTQRVDGLAVRGPGGEQILTAGAMENDRSLLALVLRGKEDLGITSIDTLAADIVADGRGGTNLMSALQSTSAPSGRAKPGFVPVLPFGGLVLGESRLTVSAPGVETARFDISRFSLELPGRDRPLRVALAAETRQGELSGKLRVEGTVEDLVDDRGGLQLPAARADLTVEARSMPVQGIDGAFGLGGLLAAALGREMDLVVGTKAALEEVTFDVELRSPTLEARLKTALRGESVVLLEPASVRFVLTPSLLSALSRREGGKGRAALDDEVPFQITLEGLRLPVLRFDPASTTLQGRIAAGGQMRFTGLEGGPVTVTSLEASMDALSLDGKVGVELQAGFIAAGAAGKAEVAGTVEGLFDERGGVDFAGAVTNLRGGLDRVPTALLDRFAGGRGILGESMGGTVHGSFKVRTEGTARTEAEVDVRSERLSAEASFTVGESLSLVRPAVARGRLTPALLGLLAPGTGVRLSGPADAELVVKRLELPLEGGEKDTRNVLSRELSMEAELSLPRAGFVLPSLGEVPVTGAVLQVTVATAEEIGFSVSAHVGLPGGAAVITGGMPVELNLRGATGLRPDGPMKEVRVEGGLTNEALRATASLTVPPSRDRISLSAPIDVEWTITEAALMKLFGDPKAGYSLRGDGKAGLRIEPFDAILKEFGLEKLSLKAKGSLPPLAVLQDGSPMAELRGISGDFEFAGRPAMMRAALAAKAAQPGEATAHPFMASVTVTEFLSGGKVRWEEAEMAASLGSKDFPLAFAGLFTASAPRLQALAGDRADLEGALRLAPLRGGRGEARISVKAPRLEGTADLALGEAVSLRNPAAFRLTVTPRSYEALLASGREPGRPARFVLAEDAVVQGRVASLSIPRRGTQTGDRPTAASFESTLDIASWMLKEGSSGRVVGLRGVSLKASTDDLSRSLGVTLTGQVADPGGGGLQADIALSNMFDKQGKTDISKAQLKLNMKTDRLPVPLLDSWMGLAGLGEAALGTSVDLTATADLSRGAGPVTFRADASRGHLDIQGAVRDGVFSLSRPLTGDLEVTEELGSSLLAKVHPFFETVHTSRDPLRLEVPKEGVAVPIRDFDISRVVVPRITVGTNRLLLRKGGTLEMLITLSQQFGGMRGVGAAGDTELWFTPLVGELRGGVFRYTNRLDLLIDRKLHAISWGTVALGPGGSSYSLKAGLPADALRKVLGTNRIGEGEVFVVPIEGREGRIDGKASLSKAVLDLGRVRGQYELSRKDPLLGLVAGQLAKKVAGTETGPIPPPSMSPLPWADLLQSEAPAPEPSPAPAPAQPPPRKEATPEDAIREVLPEELKGVFDILKPRK